MAIYKGDCRAGFTAVLGSSSYALRTVDDNTAMADRSIWELNAGDSVTLYFRHLVASGGSSTPTRVILAVYYETGTGTLVRTLHDGARPAAGTSYTFYGTSDGLVGGSPRAGTVRLYVRIINTNSPTDNYDVDSDGVAGSFGTNYVTPVAVTDQGLLRSNAKVTDLTVNAYPAGATFAHPDVVTLTAAHTQRFADRNNEIVRVDLLDGAAQQSAGSSQEVGAGTTPQNFTCNETFDAASKSYGARLVVVNNALLIPTSGAIKWTKLIDDGANVTVNGAGDEAERQSFFTADPRLSGRAGNGDPGFHFQVNRASFDTSFHEPSMAGLAPDSMQAAIRIINARGEGQNSLTVTLTADPVNPGSTVTLNTSTATRDSEAGWTELVDVSPSGKPGGVWNLSADITAPTTIDDPAYFLDSADVATVISDDPRLVLRVEAGDPATPLDHWRPGVQLVVGLAIARLEGMAGSQVATRIAYDTDSAVFLVASFNAALGRLETLAADEVTWEFTDTPHLFTAALSAGDAKLGLYTFSAATTAQWPARGSVFVEGYCTINGVPKLGGSTTDSLGSANSHAGYAIDPVALALGGVLTTR